MLKVVSYKSMDLDFLILPAFIDGRTEKKDKAQLTNVRELYFKLMLSTKKNDEKEKRDKL